MIKAMVISFCFGVCISRGLKFGDTSTVIMAIVGFIVNLVRVME